MLQNPPKEMDSATALRLRGMTEGYNDGKAMSSRVQRGNPIRKEGMDCHVADTLRSDEKKVSRLRHSARGSAATDVAEST
jgi:hypothetical protein